MTDVQQNGGAIDQEMQDVVADVDVEGIEDYTEPQRIRVVCIFLARMIVTHDSRKLISI